LQRTRPVTLTTPLIAGLSHVMSLARAAARWARVLLMDPAMAIHDRPSMAKAFFEDRRGAIYLEYVVVVTVGLLVATALSAVGASEVRTYSTARTVLSTENP
jgi:hypothetical protein